MATSNGRWKLAAHLDYIDRLVVEAVAGRAHDRLIISTPPRHGKSELISRYTPAWFLGNFPDEEVMLASYQANFAETWGRKARDLIEEHGQDLYGVAIRKDARAASEWYIEGHDGRMISAGMKGGLTGKGAKLMIIDDPVKDAEQADSEVIREKHWNWWMATAQSRLHPGAVCIVVMTRWHEDDLAGRLLAGIGNDELGNDEAAQKSDWQEIRLPALAEADDDPLEREAGEALWPERYTVEMLERLRKGQTPRWFNALYQGRPSGEEGGIFKRGWWDYWGRDDRRLYDAMLEGDVSELPHFTKIWQSWDTALKDKTTSDFNVGQVWAEFGPDRYLLRSVRKRMVWADVVEEMRTLSGWIGERWPKFSSHAIFIEAAGNAPEIISSGRRYLSGLIPVKSDTQKVARAEAITPMLRSRNVFVPGLERNGDYDPHLTPSWVQELIDECATFPTGMNDDQVDALTQALNPQRWTRHSDAPKKEDRWGKGKSITGRFSAGDA